MVGVEDSSDLNSKASDKVRKGFIVLLTQTEEHGYRVFWLCTAQKIELEFPCKLIKR